MKKRSWKRKVLDKGKIDAVYDLLVDDNKIQDRVFMNVLEELFRYLYLVCNQERVEREKSKK